MLSATNIENETIDFGSDVRALESMIEHQNNQIKGLYCLIAHLKMLNAETQCGSAFAAGAFLRKFLHDRPSPGHCRGTQPTQPDAHKDTYWIDLPDSSRCLIELGFLSPDVHHNWRMLLQAADAASLDSDGRPECQVAPLDIETLKQEIVLRIDTFNQSNRAAYETIRLLRAQDARRAAMRPAHSNQPQR